MATRSDGIDLPSIRAFISYSHKDRFLGAQAKELLADVYIPAFLAHDDLDVSEEWRERIIEELKVCDIFVPLLSANFLESKWAAQEIGFIVSRSDVVIAPISLDGTTPFGFISHIQSRRVKAGITRELLVDPLAKRVPREMLPRLIKSASEAKTFRSAEERMKSLLPLFAKFTPQQAQSLATASVANSQIWSAQLCRTEFLPAFIDAQKENIECETLRALRFQIEHNARFNGDD